ncbi:hypothetical protein FMUAM8_14660 [Nocardia cyriacigeorgica]|nr:hypothetical protein FMUAM8_14660 [Nocardia cyriacigeorgica]BDU05225.1 hypothetical protein FMUBM48_14880 [Nocardia cyriacigeorgica]
MARLLQMGLDVILQFETGMVGTKVYAHGGILSAARRVSVEGADRGGARPLPASTELLLGGVWQLPHSGPDRPRRPDSAVPD